MVMDKFDYWRLCDELTVVQAALLLADIAPDKEFHYILNWEEHKRPEKFCGTFAALSHAVRGGRIPATLYTFHESVWDEVTQSHILRDTGNPDWDKTTVMVEDLKNWLKSQEQQIESGFFFPQTGETEANTTPGYLDPKHPHYAPKLAATIAAWHAIDTNPELMRKKSVKQALRDWVEENAEQLGLIKKNETAPSKNSLDEISAVSNWDSDGGAPKTSG